MIVLNFQSSEVTSSEKLILAENFTVLPQIIKRMEVFRLCM